MKTRQNLPTDNRAEMPLVGAGLPNSINIAETHPLPINIGEIANLLYPYRKPINKRG